MKKCLYVALFAAACLIISCGKKNDEGKGTETGKTITEVKVEKKETYAPAEKEAQQILVAYITKDLELLKKYASGMMKSALSEKALERPRERERIESWDGKIKEIRYYSDEINFQKIYYAYAVYKGDPSKDEKVYAVSLKSKDKKNWYMGINSLITIKKENFNKHSSELPE